MIGAARHALLPRGGTSRIAAHRVVELTRALFLTLAGQALLRHRGASEAPSSRGGGGDCRAWPTAGGSCD